MVEMLDRVNVESRILPLNAMRVQFNRDPKACKSRHEIDLNTRLVLPDGRQMQVSDRFWSSFSSLFNLGRSTFEYFSHAEVFDRITQAKGNTIRVAFEQEGDGGRLLSCTNPGKPILQLGEVRELLTEFNGNAATYADGLVTATFDCPFPANFQIGGDDFRTQFNVQMPVDGYGLPSSFLSLLRLVCSNGLVAMSAAFKTVFQLGKDSDSLMSVLERAMVTFNNEEGFSALRQRVESASTSWASLNEARRLRTSLASAALADRLLPEERTDMLQRFDQACGDPLHIYGLTGHDELSARRARSIPVEATVYDLMNFASEASTHRLTGLMSRSRVHGWIGETVTQEYDLEGTVTQFPDFKDYFLARGNASAIVPASAN